MTDIVINFHI